MAEDEQDPPTTAANLQALTAVVEQLFRLISNQAVTFAALEDYLRAQPWFDEAAYQAHLRVQRTAQQARLEKLPVGSPAALLAMLRDFEGPPQ